MSTPTPATHLGFYTAHGISPVRQDISDLQRHFQRREALYRHLGIVPRAIHGRNVLEVGPGGGYNSLYTASLAPARFLLVEGNPTGVAEIKQLFSKHDPAWSGPLEVVLSTVEDWKPEPTFDFVFCEGLLSGVPNPEQVLDKLAGATAPGGLLTITCVDHLSHFPETLRRALGQLAVDPADSLQEKVRKILPMMESHLATLPGMSRRLDDWVIDNLIHPGSIIPLINFPEAVAVLGSRFDYYAASPHFTTDWRWYKSIVGENWEFNARAIEQFWSLAHNMLDYRKVLPPRDPAANQRLYDLCTQARAQLEGFERKREAAFLKRFRETLGKIVEDAASFSADVAEALGEAATLLKGDRPDAAAVAGAAKFGGLFGRGQQYLSLIKRGN
jgi:2-polyprenyl-3-methyl-5-hydroxy-6-metoxy-1,4-benzoquinol methylase